MIQQLGSFSYQWGGLGRSEWSEIRGWRQNSRQLVTFTPVSADGVCTQSIMLLPGIRIE